ncbi:c-type cytochrome [Azohydromonas sediminis]|uniref:c-type cytochrome n=1 Tax=Azohydromonas sediminis TaxID=2259674 RepID=UPI000E65194E|nr:c-type cytochrome [Azohydromonas sediminis]
MKRALLLLLALATTSFAHAQGAKGDAQAGARKVAMCIGCHGIPGYQASFPEIHKVPMISGQNEGYLVAALVAYKKGDRRHPTMRGIAMSLSDQDIADISAHYAAQGGNPEVPDTAAPAPARVAELLTKGACASCHGANFNKPIDGTYPKIAGQHADYLFVALRSYRTQGNPNIGRANPIMGGVVQQFSNAELKAMADYLGTLPGDLRTVPQPRFR